MKLGVPVLAVLGIGAVGAAIDESAADPTLGPAVAAPAATEASPSSPEVSVPAVEPVPTTIVEEAASAGPVPETTLPPVVDTAAPAPPPPDPGLVDVCVVFTPVAAFMSMATYQQIWNDAGQNTDTLRAHCAAMSTEQLTAISAEMQAVQAFFAAAAAPPTPVSTEPPAPVATAAPAPPPPATLPPTTLPPPPPPPTAAPLPPPPVAAPSGCDPNYTGCVPIDSDVDCAGGGGNGPSFARGPITVIGSDIYDLDRDGDGIACDR